MTPKDPDIEAREEDLPGLQGKTEKRPLYSGPGIGEGAGYAGGYHLAEADLSPPSPSLGVATTQEDIYGRVSALLEEGRLEEAEGLLARGLEIYPESVDLLKELGVLYHLRGLFGKAARTFTRVMNITGEGKQSLSWKMASLYHKALEEFGGPDPERSISSFDQILVLDPSDREALAGKIAALRVLGRLEEAQRCLEGALALVPPGPSILYQEGWLRMDLDLPDLASDAFERASLADPAWVDPVFSRALALERVGRSVGAENILRAFVETEQGIPGLRAGLGWFYLGQRKLEKAKRIFLELAGEEGDPGDFQGLAALLLATGRAQEARVIMERLAHLLPRDPLVEVNLGMVLARLGGSRDLADAAIAAKRVLSLDPRFAPAHTCLGIIASKQGRLEEAEAHFTEAVRFSDPLGHRNLGLLACARGRWEEAEPHLRRAIRLDPLDARAWAGLGAIALTDGKAKEAALHLRCAGKLDPWDTGAAGGLAIALARCGTMGEAEEVIRRALGLSPGPGRWALLVDLAALLISRGGPAGNHVLDEEARQILAEARAIRPDEPAILFYEGVVEGRLGNPKGAMERFASSMRREVYRFPAHENIRHLKQHMSGRKGLLAGFSPSRSILALFSLLQLAAAWSFFVAGLVSEVTFILLLAIFSVLFTLAVFMPARKNGGEKGAPLELVIPDRTFVPSPEADMIPPFVRLRTALRR